MNRGTGEREGNEREHSLKKMKIPPLYRTLPPVTYLDST